MTIDDVLKELRKTRHLNWYLGRHYAIRVKIGTTICCPITAISRRPRLPNKWSSVALELGLSHSEGYKLISASDEADFYDYNLRRRIMRAVGLWK